MLKDSQENKTKDNQMCLLELFCLYDKKHKQPHVHSWQLGQPKQD